MTDAQVDGPESTALRVALWRAMHVLVDPLPHVLEDVVGLDLAAPEDDWRDRPDMDPDATRGFRAEIVARARFVEDLVADEAARGVTQYVVLGAGLDTFVQRRPDLASRLDVFEVDQVAPQQWKRRRLVETGYGVPDRLHLVPVDFETGDDWSQRLVDAGFDLHRPAVVVSTGVTHYLTEEAVAAMLRRIARFAPGSTFAMTFLIPADLVDEVDRAGLKVSETGARRSGTPFVSFFAPDRMLESARDAGFAEVAHVAGSSFADRYFSGRADGLRPSSGEDVLIART